MKASWLYSKHPLVIDVRLATVIGLNEAIVLQQLNYWLHGKSAKSINGHRWVYNSYEDWRIKNFPFWKSASTVKRAFNSLRKRGLVVTGRFNKAGFDKTNWYSIDEDQLNKLMTRASVQIDPTDGAKSTDGSVQIDPTNTRDYPETTSDTNNNKKGSAHGAEPHIPYKEIIDYLNQKVGTHYKASSRANRKLIKARWDEGNRLDAFKKVIDNKAYSWQNTKWWQYMKPSTLFREGHFDEYLNENDLDKHQNQPTSGGYGGDQPSDTSGGDFDDDLPF